MLKSLSNTNTNLKKVQFSLINLVVYDLKTYNNDRVVPYCSCI